MSSSDSSIDFTGGFFVPGKSGERLEADHFERYRFASQFVKGKTVLDIACGVGYSAPLFLAAGAISYDGVDLSEEEIRYAAQTYGSSNTNFVVGDICTFDNRKTYDVISCFETIEHVDDYESALSNLYRLLKKGGRLIISSPNRIITSPHCSSLSDKPENKHHIREFIPSELNSSLENCGFLTTVEPLYGQRQRPVSKNFILRAVYRIIYRNPNVKTSPKVTPVTNKVPRYFIFVAEKG